MGKVYCKACACKPVTPTLVGLTRGRALDTVAAMSLAPIRVGVDIGGTFTDIVVARADGTLIVNKTSSTPDDPGLAVVNGLADVLRAADIPPESVVEVVHGTTVASNTIL